MLHYDPENSVTFTVVNGSETYQNKALSNCHNLREKKESKC